MNKTQLAGWETYENICCLEMVCHGRTKERHIPCGPNMLEPLSALLPAPSLQGTHSTQRTRSSAHAPEHLFYTEDEVQRPLSRAPIPHRGRGPVQEPLGLLPVLHRGSTHLLPTASPRAPPSSCLKSHNASCSEASSAEILEGFLCPSGTDACLVMGAVMSPRVRVQPGAQTGGLRPRETVGVSHGPSPSQAGS